MTVSGCHLFGVPEPDSIVECQQGDRVYQLVSDYNGDLGVGITEGSRERWFDFTYSDIHLKRWETSSGTVQEQVRLSQLGSEIHEGTAYQNHLIFVRTGDSNEGSFSVFDVTSIDSQGDIDFLVKSLVECAGTPANINYLATVQREAVRKGLSRWPMEEAGSDFLREYSGAE